MKRVDLNVDIGEGFPFDSALLQFATSGNVCCGAHAGSPELTAKTVQLCRAAGARVGAHPGFPDRASMGRDAVRPANFQSYCKSLESQVEDFCATYAADYIKPHGEAYRLCTLDHPSEAAKAIWQVFIKAARQFEIPVMMMPGGLSRELENRGTRVISEGFPDRSYDLEGKLVSRSEPDAIIHDPAEISRHAVELAPNFDSLCLHGDNEGCVENAKLLTQALKDMGFVIAA